MYRKWPESQISLGKFTLEERAVVHSVDGLASAPSYACALPPPSEEGQLKTIRTCQNKEFSGLLPEKEFSGLLPEKYFQDFYLNKTNQDFYLKV